MNEYQKTFDLCLKIFVYGCFSGAGSNLLVHGSRNEAYLLRGSGMELKAGGPNMRDNLVGSFPVRKGDNIIIELEETLGVAADPIMSIVHESLGVD